jgi:outer membrane protein TolC
MKFFNYVTIGSIACLLSIPVQAELTLQQAINDSIAADNWNRSNQFSEAAMRDNALAGGQLPDPRVRLGLANLPTDTFDFDQENMTQLQFGLSQQFPRGSSLQIKEQQMNQMADRNPLQRANRRAEVKLRVTQRWLLVHQLQQQSALLEKNRHLFQELLDTSRANYRSGKTQRFDVLTAELKLTRLNDQLATLNQQLNVQKAQLERWLPVGHSIGGLPRVLPKQSFVILQQTPEKWSEPLLQQAVLQHPRIQVLDQEIKVQDSGVQLAEQAYKPSYKLEANYGYRDDRPDGMDRSDLFSVAVSFDLPLFTEKRQDAKRNASIQQRESVRETRLLKVRELYAELQREIATYQGLKERLSIYKEQLLTKLHAQRRAALQAYASADGRFMYVTQAAMTELENKMQKLALEHQLAISVSQINYRLAGMDESILTDSEIRAENVVENVIKEQR